jgi:hypothetical protein
MVCVRSLIAAVGKFRPVRPQVTASPVLESLEPRCLLDGAGPAGLWELVGTSPAIDPSVRAGGSQAAPAIEPAAASSPYSLDQTFLLHSNPGASKVIYLDFDGHVTTGTSWNVQYGDPITTPAFSFEGDSSFSDNELSRIQYIWQRVAEDYLPFNVDVTTEEPAEAALRRSSPTDTTYGVRICIGGNSDWYGEQIGGVANIGSFDLSSDTPAFVFPSNLGNNEKYVAEAITHEAGHTVDLYHDGTTDGVEYYQGHGSGATGWAPIMGVGYYKPLTQWSKGEYADANNSEDDLYIIAEKSNGSGRLGYRADDHGDASTSATVLPADGTTIWGAGIIERNTDLDFFSFYTGSGTVTLSVSPAARGPNLDILATLYDGMGAVVDTSNPIGALDASFSLPLSAGTYYLSIDGTGEGDPATGYSDYASLGYYAISGTVVDELLPEVTIEATDAAAAEQGPDPAVLRISRTGDTDAPLEVYYTVSGSADNGVDYQAVGASTVIPAGAAWAEVAITPIDDSDYEGSETVRLTLDSHGSYAIGSPAFAEAEIEDNDPAVSIDSYAISEEIATGSIVGSSLADTLADDDVYEELKEASFGNPGRGYSTLSHTWTFDLPEAWAVTFHVEAHHTANSEGDDFAFEWSADGQTWAPLLTVTKTADDDVAQSAVLPNGQAGTVYVRVTDTDQTPKARSLDSLYVDEMFIRSDPRMAGDLDGDGDVDNQDLGKAGGSFTGAGGSTSMTWEDGDMDGDGDVDNADLGVIGGAFTGASAGGVTASGADEPQADALEPTQADPLTAAEDSARPAGDVPSSAAEGNAADVLAMATRLSAGPIKCHAGIVPSPARTDIIRSLPAVRTQGLIKSPETPRVPLPEFAAAGAAPTDVLILPGVRPAKGSGDDRVPDESLISALFTLSRPVLTSPRIHVDFSESAL